MESDFTGPVNIGSEEMITINDLALMVMDIAGKPLGIRQRSRTRRACAAAAPTTA